MGDPRVDWRVGVEQHVLYNGWWRLVTHIWIIASEQVND